MKQTYLFISLFIIVLTTGFASNPEVNTITDNSESISEKKNEFVALANCQNITVQLNASGTITIAEDAVNNGSTGLGTLTFDTDVTVFTCADIGNNTVTLTVTDSFDGSTDSCSATVTVQDNMAPNAICQDITVQLDNNGNASVSAAQVDNGSNDNCGIASLSLSQTAFTCADVGANTVTLTVTDDNGNTDTCTATVTV
ncbi:MAG: HYR domain-containing protein, partial [Flavobacteriaceae bacterium]|nr:HYR domain-containing protein [Flavobacteriaceae bacterium]